MPESDSTLDPYRGLPPKFVAFCKHLRYVPREPQRQIHAALLGGKNVVATIHRRGGKSVCALIHSFYVCLNPPHPWPQCFFVAPKLKQAKRIIWPYATRYAQMIPGAEVRQLDLMVRFPTGGTFSLLGSDTVGTNRGIYADFVVVDEAQDTKPEAWFEVFLPALADREGNALVVGTPQFHDPVLYRLMCHAQEAKDWERFLFPVSKTKILSEQVLASMRATMSREEYEREMEVRFDFPPRGAVYNRWMLPIILGERNIVCEPGPDASLPPPIVGLGLSDRDVTPLWLFQRSEERLRIIEFVQLQEQTFDHALEQLSKWKVRYGAETVIIPPNIDVEVELVDAERRVDKLMDNGFDVISAADFTLMDSIDVVRSWLTRMEVCEGAEEALDVLTAAAFDYDDKLGQTVGRMSRKTPYYDAEEIFRYACCTPVYQEDEHADDKPFEINYDWVV